MPLRVDVCYETHESVMLEQKAQCDLLQEEEQVQHQVLILLVRDSLIFTHTSLLS